MRTDKRMLVIASLAVVTLSVILLIMGEVEAQNEPPVVSCSLDQNSTVSGKVTIRGHAYDIDGQIELVQVKIDNGDWKEANGRDDWKFTWDTEKVDLGWHTISVRSYDGEDNSEILQVQVIVEEPNDGIDKYAGLLMALTIAGIVMGITMPLLYLNRERLKNIGNKRIANDHGVNALHGMGSGKTTQAYGEIHPIKSCEVCGQSKMYYPQYQRYYCHTCQQYR